MRHCAALLMLALLSACHREAPAPVVEPHSYDAFYVWPGVTPPDTVRPRLLYLLDGEVRRGGPARFLRLRPGVPHLPGTPLWLVVRANRLDWTPALASALVDELERWQRAGNDVMGLQIDFDAATQGIGRYQHFLTQVRTWLPPRWRLSITGLMDWSAHGDPQALRALRPVIDEVVVQTYQGRATIPGYDAYFRAMRGFPIPFRVALVQGGTWTPPAELKTMPGFRGYVVFLLRQRPHG